MSSSTFSDSYTFTINHARHMGAKVATDLKRMQRFYGQPSDIRIANFEEEISQLLRNGFLERATYGYRKDGMWIEPTLRYTARDLADGSADDDDPGRVRPGADIEGAYFYSYVTYNSAWLALTPHQREAFEQSLPLQRTGAAEPTVNGYLRSDRTYSAGGWAIDRQSVKAS